MAGALALVLSAATIAAQEKPAGKQEMKAGHDHSAMQKEAKADSAGFDVPKSSPEMEKLSHWLMGRWETVEKHEPSPWMPEGATGMGVDRFMPGPGGFSLMSHYASRSTTGMKFRGHGILFWDGDAKLFRSFWCDNMTPKCMSNETGKWEGEELVFSGEGDFMGTKMKTRAVYTDIKPDSFTFYMDATGEDGATKRLMAITYKKVMSRHMQHMQHMQQMKSMEEMEKNE